MVQQSLRPCRVELLHAGEAEILFLSPELRLRARTVSSLQMVRLIKLDALAFGSAPLERVQYSPRIGMTLGSSFFAFLPSPLI
jgi:hypothetical protein